MAIFEKTEYWGLKDPLEVRVQHGTCIYMGDTFSSHFEPKKFNRVGRRGQKQPKWGIFGGTKTFDFSSKKKDFLPKNDQIWPKIGIFGQFGPGHAGLFSALLVGRLVVVARGLYLARHLFTL